MSIDTQSCCELHGLVKGCDNGRSCPLLADPCEPARHVQHLRYRRYDEAPPTPPSATLPADLIEGMDDTLTFETGA